MYHVALCRILYCRNVYMYTEVYIVSINTVYVLMWRRLEEDH